MTLSEIVPERDVQHGMTCVAAYSLLLLLGIPLSQLPSSSRDVFLGKQNLIKCKVNVDTIF